MGSQENIAQAKCELLAHIPSDGVIALNSSDRALIAPWLDTCKGRIVWYDSTGRDKNAEYRAENIIQHAEGITYELYAGDHSEKIHLAVHGVHNVSNSMAAIAIAREVGARYVALKGQVDAIIVTGGIAHSEYCMKVFLPWIDYLAPIVMMPGEDEMGSLANNAWCALKGERKLKVYNPA